MRKASRNLLVLPAITLVGAAALGLATPGESYADTVLPTVEPVDDTQSAVTLIAVAEPSLNDVVHAIRDEADTLVPGDPTGEGCVRIALGICYYPDPGNLLH